MNDSTTDTTKVTESHQEERFREATERLKQIQAEIAPYLKARKPLKTSTAGKWSSGSPAVAQLVKTS